MLTTLGTIKNYMQITNTISDVLLVKYQSIVESEIEAFCNVNLKLNTYTEPVRYEGSTLDTSGYIPYDTQVDNPTIYLRNKYVTSFTLVYNSTTTVNDSSYSLDEDNGVVTMYAYYDTTKKKLKAHYTAGYTTITAPLDLQSVVMQGVRSYYEAHGQAKQNTSNITSKSVLDFSVNYGDNLNNSFLSKNENGEVFKTYLISNKAILSKYKRIYI